MNNPVKFVLLLTACSFPKAVLAHSPLEGVESFYNGLLHPVLVPAHLLLAIALGLFLGQRGLEANQKTVLFFLVATVTGLSMAWFVVGLQLEVFILLGAAITGLMVAANVPMRPFWCSVFAVIAGVLLGIDSQQETLSGEDKLVALVGTGIGIYFLLLFSIALTRYFNSKSWQKTGIRIIGSWIAASSLLVLALAISSVQKG